MTTLTETRHPGSAIIAEADNFHCRDEITIQSGEGVILPNQVLGKVRGDADTISVGTVTFVGTGDGVLTKATPASGVGVRAGNYKVICIEPAADAGTFAVEDPTGLMVGVATVGVAFTGVVKFTIADGAANFVAGDTFTIPVTIATDAKEYRSCDNTNTDGSEVARAIAVYGCDATSAAQKIAAIVRGPAQVDNAQLVYDAALNTAGEKATAHQQLAANGIVVR